MIDGSTPLEERMKFAASHDAETVMNEFNSRPEGHYNEEVTTSRIKFGDNIVSNHNKHAILKRLYHAYVNVFIIALLAIDILWPVTAIISGEEIDYAYIVILTTLIFVSGAMTFIQETRSNNAAAKLVSMVTTIITLKREDVEVEVDSADLVVGDIIILDAGDMIPADIRILQSNNLKVDQSALTGESGGVTKTDAPISNMDSIFGCSNMAFMGSNVISGSAVAIVVAVGDDTIIGSMTEKISRGKVPTTYTKGSKEITKVLVKLMVFMIPPVFVIMLIKGFMNNQDAFSVILEAVMFAITLAIGLMPEMLATIVSTNLAKGAVDLSKKKVIVKDSTAIQNFGAMDVLCSDKTGTLTQNRISVHGCNNIYGNADHAIELFTCLNSANLKSSKNQIDWALDDFAEENGLKDEMEAYPYVADIPFDFVRRRTTVVLKQDEEQNLVITKGATPEILSTSHSYLDENKEVKPLDEKIQHDIMGLVEWYSQKGMRVLGVGYKYVSSEQKTFSEADECNLIFAGFVVFTDPTKKTAKKAIADMKEYGITTKVLTGDNEYVTKYVCDEIGVRTDNMIIGPQIDDMSDEELRDAVEETDVFVRLTPDNKSRIVVALRANGHTVGLMGDGINDVLAMKNADISIAVDTGTDIAKDTASMILLEKDLNILKDGAIEGRKVYVNTIKYVKMIGSINFGYMFSLILATLLFNFTPMGAMMILIFNLVNDFACLVIPWDTVEDEFVREPRKWDAPNLKQVMFHYGPMCPITDILTWAFIVFVVFSNITITVDGQSWTYMDMVVQRVNWLGDGYSEEAKNAFIVFEITFQTLWCIEQYWMQVWSIHIVRTNKLPFFQTMPAKILIITTILALLIGTLLPFSPLWEMIAGGAFIDPFPYWALLWMPLIAVIYFFGSHYVKKRMLVTHGYFAC